LLDFEIKACTAIFIGMEGVYKLFFSFSFISMSWKSQSI